MQLQPDPQSEPDEQDPWPQAGGAASPAKIFFISSLLSFFNFFIIKIIDLFKKFRRIHTSAFERHILKSACFFTFPGVAFCDYLSSHNQSLSIR